MDINFEKNINCMIKIFRIKRKKSLKIFIHNIKLENICNSDLIPRLLIFKSQVSCIIKYIKYLLRKIFR